jgi:hypothetical protein
LTELGAGRTSRVTSIPTMKVYEVMSDKKGAFELPTRLAPSRYKVIAAEHRANPMRLMIEMNKNRRMFELPEDKTEYELVIKLK